MSTLLNINGSMKEFAEDIEEKMSKAFRSKAGKKYGLTDVEIEMRKLKNDNGSLGFNRVKESMKDIDRQAKQYIYNQHGNINLKFLKKNIL